MRFAIGPGGAVESAAEERSDLPDADVIRCVVAEFKQMRFPKPVGDGPVKVIYPVVFNPVP